MLKNLRKWQKTKWIQYCGTPGRYYVKLLCSILFRKSQPKVSTPPPFVLVSDSTWQSVVSNIDNFVNSILEIECRLKARPSGSWNGRYSSISDSLHCLVSQKSLSSGVCSAGNKWDYFLFILLSQNRSVCYVCSHFSLLLIKIHLEYENH